MGQKVYTKEKLDALLNTKLDASNGTLTGTINVYGNTSVPALTRSGTNNSLSIKGGSPGAQITIYGNLCSSKEGFFNIIAATDTSTCTFSMRPYGRLIWNYNPISISGFTNTTAMSANNAVFDSIYSSGHLWQTFKGYSVEKKTFIGNSRLSQYGVEHYDNIIIETILYRTRELAKIIQIAIEGEETSGMIRRHCRVGTVDSSESYLITTGAVETFKDKITWDNWTLLN